MVAALRFGLLKDMHSTPFPGFHQNLVEFC
jgi:hypothetical protein